MVNGGRRLVFHSREHESEASFPLAFCSQIQYQLAAVTVGRCSLPRVLLIPTTDGNSMAAAPRQLRLGSVKTAPPGAMLRNLKREEETKHDTVCSSGGSCLLGSRVHEISRSACRCATCDYEGVYKHALARPEWRYPRERGETLPAHFPDPRGPRRESVDENGYGNTFDASTKRWVLRRVAKAEPPAPVYYPGQRFDPRWLKKVIERPQKDAE